MQQPPRIEHRSHSDEWATPTALFDMLNQQYGPFDLDIAASDSNTKVPTRYFTINDDALTQNWNCQAGYCNPPYSKVAEFSRKAIVETQSGRAARVLMLVPARTSSRWFRELSDHGAKFVPISGRITFEGANDPAPFDSCVLVLDAPPETWNTNQQVTYTIPTRHPKAMSQRLFTPTPWSSSTQ